MAEGSLRKQIETWQERLLGLSAAAERAIDYAEEDESTADAELATACGTLAADLREWLERPRAERLKDGVKVVIAGPPNAGKSSLLNAIVQEERAIVTEIPGTTRDHIEVPLAIDGVPLLVIDTAGLRDSEDRVEAIGVSRAESLVKAADILIWLGDPNDARAHPCGLQVHAKSDLSDRHAPPAGAIAVSSLTGAGVDVLLEHVLRAAKMLLPAEDALALNRRQAKHMEEAAEALGAAAATDDAVLLAENIRLARGAFDRLTGRAGMEDVLDALFSRFCLGK
jgi:tRNA modification GTPase